MKKRVLSLLLISCLLLTAGCGEKSSSKEDKKEDSNIKTLSCTVESEKTEIDEDEDGNSIMGIQGQTTEYKYDTKKNELVEMTSTAYIKFENASSDYISKQTESAESSCDMFKDEDSVKSCKVKKDGQKIELQMVADVEKALEDNEDINKNSSFEEIEKYAKEFYDDDKVVCTVK